MTESTLTDSNIMIHNDDYKDPSFLEYPFTENNLSQDQKIHQIEIHFESILKVLGLNVQDETLNRTPHRYAKMLVKELFEGLDRNSFPAIMTQENKFKYDNMLVQTNISIHSICEHHFVPILGFCHIAYIPNKKIIGLSKLNRISKHFGKRPQVQERMTNQISKALSEILETPDVAIVVDALHLCVKMRGVQDQDSLTRTSNFNGKFQEIDIKNEFLQSIPKLKDFVL